ncbi:hypothetical protein Agabi119p4_9467 [Agaricus bisporus var. burnettii]|uniref:Uncharacterized protein n=1 Tax=Agaricus bisporus var. burnettii TaxID=192524 RepID=A0A8H7C3U2_AGABI|nr:hypothetical protein Agabi119p4_9467 [Agaricus bisporus var. burnettii]
MDGTDRLYNSAIHLISPPPEETLRKARPSSPPASKRKRGEPVTTPNPRLRKQQRDNASSENLLSVPSRRSRSATPIPPYEPPTDIFTPPRQVFVSPTATVKVSKSSKRKSAKKKRTPTPVVVKLEMPDIDLTAPMPPPSPGDDPLLLTSSPTKPRGPAFSESDLFDIHKDNTVTAPTRRTVSPAFIKKLRFDDLPPSSPPQENISSPDQPADMPLFDLDAWTDSDEDELPILSEGQSDYTGKWQDVMVRTKVADPPNMSKEDKWPFPLSLEKAPPFALVHKEDDVEPDPFDFSGIPDDELGEAEGDSDVVEMDDHVEVDASEDAFEMDDHVEVEPSEDAVEMGDHVEVETSEPLQEDAYVEAAVEMSEDAFHNEAAVEPSEPPSEQQSPEPESNEPHTLHVPTAEEDDNSTDDEPDIVKITSADPRAAARAAAILKQHNYDCFTRRELKKKTMRRRSSAPFDLARAVFEGGVRKRRRTIGVRGEDVFIPGSPATTLPKLLKEVELEVSMLQSPITDHNPFTTPLPNRHSSFLGLTPKVPMTPGETCYDPLTGERMWTKEEWKRLDACFTDERLEVGAKLGLVEEEGLASVDLVDLEHVLRRFVDWMGGEEAVAEYGPEWSRENLMQRTRALRRKQRNGKVAPPTTLPASPWSLGSVEVPEFTPIRFKPSRRREWTSHVPEETPSQQAVKPVPPTLLAPRYSHLLEEAISISKEISLSDTLVDDQGHESDDGSPSTLVEEPEFILESSPTLEEEEIQPDTIGKRVKGILFSYLPTLKKSTIRNSKGNEKPGLPLPPQDVLTRLRGPVMTPAREPLPKVKPPKELVQLQQAPPVRTPTSKIEKVVHPKELVELNHVTPKVKEGERRERRRSSGAGSVKELIKGFEDMDKEREIKGEKRGEVRRMKSVGEWRKGVNGGGEVKRPVWKF